MTQPVTTSACLVSSGVVVPPMMMTFTFSRGTWYFASTASRSGRAVPWMPTVLPAKSAGVLMPDSRRKKNANGWRWNALANALSGTPRLRPDTRTPIDATLPMGVEPLATTPTGSIDGPPGTIFTSRPASLKYPFPIAVKSPAICELANHPSCNPTGKADCALAAGIRPATTPAPARTAAVRLPCRSPRRVTGWTSRLTLSSTASSSVDRSFLLETYFFQRRRPGIGVDQHQRGFLHTRPHSTRPYVVPDGPEPHPLVQELLDLAQEGLALLPV